MVPAGVALLDHPVVDLDRRGESESAGRADGSAFQRGGDREGLEGRAGLVGVRGADVQQVFRLGFAQVVEIDRRPVRHRKDVRGLGIHHHGRRIDRVVVFADLGQHPLGFRLDRRVEGELDRLAVLCVTRRSRD